MRGFPDRPAPVPWMCIAAVDLAGERGIAVAKVSPFHSSNPTDPDVYHDQSECHAGKRIPSQNKRQGTGGYRKCRICADLG